MNVIATKENYRNYNFKAGAKVQINGVDLWDDNGDITAEWAGGTVPDPATFEETVNFENTVVLEAGAELQGPLYATGGAVALAAETEQEVVTAGGALSLTAYNYLIDTTAEPLAITIGAPAFPRQRIRLQMIVDGGAGINDATFTFNGTATLVFADAGDYAELQHNGADWIPVVNVNLYDGSIPVYTPAA